MVPALKLHAAEWSRQNEIHSSLQLKGEQPLPLEIEQSLFRIVQEALANVARHSMARNVDMTLLFKQEHLILKVADDGEGFDSKSQPSGFGLRSMKQRAEALGGEFAVEAAPERGTTLTVKIPIPESNGSNREKADG